MHTGAPFRELRLRSCSIWDYVSIRRHSEFLASARAIHWNVQQNTVWWGRPQHQSTNSLSVSSISFRHILSILSGPSSLHTLSLTGLRVEPVHQKLILSIKTLRSLKLVNSGFISTPTIMPRSSITTLWLDGSFLASTKHLLTLLRSSLETLRFTSITETYEVLASTPLPRLTFLEKPYVIGAHKYDHFDSSPNIRVLIISSLGDHPIPPTTLPHLTYLSAPYPVAKALLPGRPVRTYRTSYVYSCCDGSHIAFPLREVAPCAQHVEELQLSTVMRPERLVGLLAVHLPNLMRVRLMTGEFNFKRDPVVPQSVHRSLKEIDIGFAVMTGRSFPREDCWAVLRRLTEMCPALEVVRFGALFPIEGGGIDERNVPLDWLMDIRQTAKGEWKERKWGV